MSCKKESRLDCLLHQHSRKGNLIGVRQVLESGRVHPDSKDKDGTTPLMLAVMNGRKSVVSLLLEEGADPSSRQITGVTPIFVASSMGFKDIVSLLVESGADVDPQSQEGGTPLMAAAQADHLDVIEYLTEHGANVENCTWDGATPLFLAAQNGHGRIVQHLISLSDLPLNQQRRDGASPLWIAAQMGHDRCVSLLLRAGADVDLARYDGVTPLFKACQKGHDGVVREILQHKPSLSMLEVSKILKLLKVPNVIQNGSTPLHAAAQSSSASLVLRLLAAGSDPDISNMSGLTAFDVAFGGARKALGDVTTRMTDGSLLRGVDMLTRSLTPDKLSGLRSGTKSFIKSSLERRSHSPLNSTHTSPIRRLSVQCSSWSPSTCPTTPCLGTPSGSPSPNTTPKHSVHFIDPHLFKDGVLVTKVQCKLLSAREVILRENSPVHLAHRRESASTSLSSSPLSISPLNTRDSLSPFPKLDSQSVTSQLVNNSGPSTPKSSLSTRTH